MDPKELFAKALDEAGGCVMRVEASQMDNPTPCSEWNLRELLNHTIYELLWLPDLLQGKTIAEVGDKYEGDVLGDDVQAAWKRAADAALAAVKDADLKAVVHLSYGDKPAEHYIREMATEMLLHGWDIGQGMDCSLMFDPQAAQAVYDNLLPNKDTLAGTGLFAPALSVPDDSTVQVKLLALVGRHTAVA